jgi:SNF2 family DNA or RNA helicase
MAGDKTYGKLRLNSTEAVWVLEDVQPHVVIRLKQLFQSIPKFASKEFTLPNQLHIAADLVWFISRYPMAMTGQDEKLLGKSSKEYSIGIEKKELILLPNYTPKERPGLLPGQILKNYQRVAIDFASTTKKMLLLDEMGLGKTYEGLGMCLIPGNLPAVIVMEAALQRQWYLKAKSFIDLRVHEVKGNTPYTLPDADIYLFKYTQLSPWCDVLSRGWVKALIFDEVQNLRTGIVSSKGAAAAALCKTVDFVVGLTGTLVYNYGIEAWNIIDIMSPGTLGSQHEFEREWCDDSGSSKGIVKDPDALGSYLRELQFMLRRSRLDVGQECMQLAPEIINVEPNTKLIKEMDKLAEDLAMTIFTTNDIFERRNASGQFDLRMRQMTGVSKAHAVAVFVRMLVESGSPVVLFGYHREVYEIWARELKDLEPAWYTGKETPSQKEASKARFITGQTNLIIISLRSGVGLDGLQGRASNVVFGELDWSPNIHSQCIARLDRDGQLFSVFVYYLVTMFGSDPAMMDVLGMKKEQNRGIVDPGVKTIALASDRDRIRNMAKAFLAAKGVVIPLNDSINTRTNAELSSVL